MLDPFEAADRIAGSVAPLTPVSVPLEQADGLVLAADVVSPIALPRWANSAMDGYACRAIDVRGATPATPRELRVVENVRAGQFPTRALGAGETTRIATGAPTPDGADTVIRIEDTDGGHATVRVRDDRDAARNVRPAGEDVRENEIVLRAGALLGAAQISLLASVGAAAVRVFRRPRVAVISTGDELVRLEQFGEVLAGRRIVSSNSYGLCAAVRAAGGEPVDLGIVPDDPAATRDAFRRAADCDLILTSAGVSVGEADHVKNIVSELGGSVDFWRVRMRPGSPLAFGTVLGKPWLGLPGNPVSSLVTFELFAKPCIRKLSGQAEVRTRPIRVVVDEAISVPAPPMHFLRVLLTESTGELPRASLTGPQASNILSSFARANALLIIPADRKSVAPGDVLEAIRL